MTHKSRKALDEQQKNIRKEALKNETKADKFKRLSVKRMRKVLKEMKGIINLSTTTYESTKEEQDKIINALKLKVQDIENSFKVQNKEKEEAFTL